MKKRILLLCALAVLVLALPFLFGNSNPIPSNPVAETVPSVSPSPVLPVIHFEIPSDGDDDIPVRLILPSNTADPSVALEPSRTAAPSASSTSPSAKAEQPVSSDKGLAFLLTVNGKEVAVASSVDEKTLEQSPGWLDSSAKPGEEGVCVVYGHRNRNHLKALQKIDYGDAITVTMPDGRTYVYTVESTEILDTDEELRIPNLDGKHLMLTTCYPFYYSGHAPKKFVVTAALYR